MSWDDENDFSDFMSGGRSKSYQFNIPGDSVTGRIVKIEKQQQTDMDKGTPKVFPNGQPMMMWAVTLQTELRNGEGLRDFDPREETDDGLRTVYLKWKSEEAVKLAIRASGAQKPEIDGILTLIYSRPGPKQGNFNTKLWEARYVPPQPGQQFAAQPAPQQPQQQRQGGGWRTQPKGTGYGDRSGVLGDGGKGSWTPSSTLEQIQQSQQSDTPPF